MTAPTLLVLAAGMGSRYGGLKQLEKVGPAGETIIDYSIFDARRAGFGKVVFVIRPDIEDAFEETFGKRFREVIPTEYVFQNLEDLPEGFSVPEGRVKPWGTGHAIRAARNAISEPFAMINGDDFYGADAFKVMADFLISIENISKPEYCMVGYQLRNTLSEFGSVSRGICQSDDSGFLQLAVETHGIRQEGGDIICDDPESGEPKKLTGGEIVSMNLWGFTPALFGQLEKQFGDFLNTRGGEEKSEFYIPTVVNNEIGAGTAAAKVLESSAKWFGVTYREDREQVEKSIGELTSTGVYPQPLWKEEK